MNSVAFVCPIYDMRNDFDLGIDLCKSKILHNIEAQLILIFSNEEQKLKFKNRVQLEIGETDIIYDVIPKELCKYKAQAVTKKIYGLWHFMDNYKYIVLTDCESVFIREFNVEKVVQQIWETRNMLVSNLSPDGFFILRNCYKAMGLYYNRELRKALGGFKYNFWFNDLQVYDCSYLPDFFKWFAAFDQEKF